MSEVAPDPQGPYTTAESGASVYRMTFLFDVEAPAPAIAKFRTKNLIDAIFAMMDKDQGVRLKGAVAAGEAAQWIRGISYIGDHEAVTHPFDLAEFERMRNAILEGAAAAGVDPDALGDALTDAQAKARLDLAGKGEGPENGAGGGEGRGTTGAHAADQEARDYLDGFTDQGTPIEDD